MYIVNNLHTRRYWNRRNAFEIPVAHVSSIVTPVRDPEVKKQCCNDPNPFRFDHDGNSSRALSYFFLLSLFRWSPISPWSSFLFFLSSSLFPPSAYSVLVTLWWNSFACLYVSSRATRYNATPGCIVDQSHQTNQWLQHDMTTAWCRCNRSYFQRFFHLMSWKLHLTVYLNLLHGRSMISRIVLRNNTIIFMIKIRYFYVKMFRCFIKKYITSKLVKLFISQVINQVINYFN